MGPGGEGFVSSFLENNIKQMQNRDKFLKPYYEKFGDGYKFFEYDDEEGKNYQLRSIDTAFNVNGRVRFIEEKIIPPPPPWKPMHSRFAIETESNSNPGHKKSGWIETAECEYLLYSFVSRDFKSLEVYIMNFEELKNWFNQIMQHGQIRFERYTEHTTKEINRSKTRLVHIEHVLKEVTYQRFTLPGGEPWKLP